MRGTVCTIGTFDGVHRGHQLVLQRLVERARAHGLPAVLVTFDPHPLEVVNPAAAPPLLTLGDEKSEVLAESPLDYVVVLPFTPTLARYEAADFVDHVLVERVGERGRRRVAVRGEDVAAAPGRQRLRQLVGMRGEHQPLVALPAAEGLGGRSGRRRACR